MKRFTLIGSLLQQAAFRSCPTNVTVYDLKQSIRLPQENRGDEFMHAKKKLAPETESKKHFVLLILSILIFIWSCIKPCSYDSWFLLSLPAVLYISALACTYRRFKFTTFAYFMVFLHVLILLVGAKYTYGLNPLFLEIKEMFNLSRNHFDRIGHFAQGFAPFFLVREFFLRKGYFKKGKYFRLLVFSIILAISATYELLEFAVTIITGEPMEVILSTQGDPWDTHWDMIMALIGAASAQLLLSKPHDKKIDEMI